MNGETMGWKGNRKKIPGFGSLIKRGRILHIAYYHRGKEHRESSYSESENKALRLLKKRVGEISTGRFIGPKEDCLTFDDLVKGLVLDYQIHNRRSLSTATNHIRHLNGFFAMTRAVNIGSTAVEGYQKQRQDENASVATINREVACLGHMLSLAVDSNPPKLSRKPKFKMLDGEKDPAVF